MLTSGVMFECIKRDVDYVLAGSIRDDGPLPDTVMDLVEAQDRYTEALQGVKLVLVLSTMLHGIGVGNMLPAWVRLVCVDINPAVVTKLADRGSSQTIGIVTDVGSVSATAGVREPQNLELGTLELNLKLELQNGEPLMLWNPMIAIASA